ncbi:MAG: hypothetical protein HY514_03610 [Candidatus Aenigmarchaeota archaeon]|nr:hypothetical protein [Candidatus Aenigmarchaeota archaeon]
MFGGHAEEGELPEEAIIENIKLKEGQEMALRSLDKIEKKNVVPWHLPLLKDFCKSI